VLFSDVAGIDAQVASDKLQKLGLVVDLIQGDTVDANDPKVNTVYNAQPLGSLDVGTTVELFYYVSANAVSPSPSPSN
jgi:hypothetical protein